jgi:hypothetical protein
VLQTVNGIASAIEAAKQRLSEAMKVKLGVYEELLFPDAVIYVREAAPVFVRIRYEFAVTAADAAENVERLANDDIYMCCIKCLEGSSCPSEPKCAR